MTKAFLVLFGLTTAFATAELTLCLVGFPLNGPPPNLMPGTHSQDPILGWKHKAGKFTFSSNDQSTPFTVTYWTDETRATNEFGSRPDNRVILLGCSFVEGFGLDDKESLGWQLQTRIPQVGVVNLGSSGYGTVHSLLSQRKFLSENPGISRPIVIYGYADFHPARNVRNFLTQRHWGTKAVFPICDLESCSSWPGIDMTDSITKYSRILSLARDTYDSLEYETRRVEAEEVTLQLIRQMKGATEARQGHFFVSPVLLSSPDLLAKMASMGISLIDCDPMPSSIAGFHLEDGHPNGRWNTSFAECLKSELQELRLL